MKFKPGVASALDSAYGIEILRPRVEPWRSPTEFEFQFPIYHAGEAYGFACYGEIVDSASGHKQTWTLRLSNPSEIDSILRKKILFGVDADNLSFLLAFAQGLICVYEDGTLVDKETDYFVIIDEHLLASIPEAVNADMVRSDNGDVVLSRLQVAASPSTGDDLRTRSF